MRSNIFGGEVWAVCHSHSKRKHNKNWTLRRIQPRSQKCFQGPENVCSGICDSVFDLRKVSSILTYRRVQWKYPTCSFSSVLGCMVRPHTRSPAPECVKSTNTGKFGSEVSTLPRPLDRLYGPRCRGERYWPGWLYGRIAM